MAGIARGLKDLSKRMLRKVFEVGQHAGIDILPRHFYSEIPDLRALRRSDHWKQPYSMIGVPGADLDHQLRFLQEICRDDLIERLRHGSIHPQACRTSGEVGFGPIESDFLYCFIQAKRPPRILQVGCGVSTAVCQLAASDAGYEPGIICVEPYPNEHLRAEAREGRIELIRRKIEDSDVAPGALLSTGDLFFVDGTHTLGPAGEVSRIVLEMLPRLRAGVWVHFHDILFPYDYPRYLMSTELFFAHESALLHAFLLYNSRFEIAVSLSMLHHERPDDLRRFLPNYDRAPHDAGLQVGRGHRPSSTYLRVVGG